jgi:hypothetical protein
MASDESLSSLFLFVFGFSEEEEERRRRRKKKKKKKKKKSKQMYAYAYVYVYARVHRIPYVDPARVRLYICVSALSLKMRVRTICNRVKFYTYARTCVCVYVWHAFVRTYALRIVRVRIMRVCVCMQCMDVVRICTCAACMYVCMCMHGRMCVSVRI